MENNEITWEVPYPPDFQRWHLFYPEHPWTTNRDRNFHHMARAKLIREWRGAFKQLAEDAQIPELEVLFIEIMPQVPKRLFQDTAACNPASKAAIDGLIDAGVMEDDSSQWLKWILFHPCIYVKGEPGLHVLIVGRPK